MFKKTKGKELVENFKRIKIEVFKQELLKQPNNGFVKRSFVQISDLVEMQNQAILNDLKAICNPIYKTIWRFGLN